MWAVLLCGSAAQSAHLPSELHACDGDEAMPARVAVCGDFVSLTDSINFDASRSSASVWTFATRSRVEVALGLVGAAGVTDLHAHVHTGACGTGKE